MKRGIRAALVGVLFLVVPFTGYTAELIGRVMSLADGGQPRGAGFTAYAAQDSPGRHRCTEKAQPFGERSRQKLARTAFGKYVRVEWTKRDRYQRIVGKVWVQSPDAPCRGKPDCSKTLDAGLAQLTVGLAWWFRKYATEQSAEDRGRYEHAEFEAKIRRAGLWSEKAPIPPWEWRGGARSE